MYIQKSDDIYFIEAVGLDLVKIGITSDIEQRLKTLEGMSPVTLNLLAVMQGVSKEAERWIHHLFIKDCDHGEWFRLTEELRQFIRTPTVEFLQKFIEDEDGLQLSRYLLPVEGGDYEFQFGKHRNERLSSVLAEDCRYVQWMIQKGYFPLSVKKILAEAMRRNRDTEEVMEHHDDNANREV